MRVTATDFPGLLVLEPRVFRDPRGFFLESWNRECFREAGIAADFIQDNQARSEAAGVLRGFHFQRPPAAQAKLVWVTRGAVLDAALDLRHGSPTFGRVFAAELSAENFRRIFIPKGFAHAYLTLAPGTDFFYKVDAPYAPDLEGGVLWNDPDLGFSWPAEAPQLSDKDRGLPRLASLDVPFAY